MKGLSLRMIYVFLAEGFEEIEAVTPIDMLRRCEKDVIIVGIGSKYIKGSHGIALTADISDNDVMLDDKIEMIVLPGGMPGTLNLQKSDCVKKAVEYCVNNNKYIGAICAAPSVLGILGILEGKKATCYPGFESQLYGAVIEDDYVVVDDKIITAKGAGVSIEFGKALVSALLGDERADMLCASMKCRS